MTETEPDFSALKSRPLRDLAWALSQPPLFCAIPDFDSEWFLRDYIDEQLWPWLVRIDKDPTDLLAHMASQRSTRLGIYFEQLLSFYFTHFPNNRLPRFQLVAKNYQVYRDKRTLGEFDFILYDNEKQQTLHIEAAIKFYLGYTTDTGFIRGNTAFHDWHKWVGPGQKDTLAIKMTHLKQHQLQLSQIPEGLAALAAMDPPALPVNRRLLYSGYFYFPLGQTMACPRYSAVAKKYHYWLRIEDIERLSQQLPDQYSYCLAPRQLWMSPITRGDLLAGELPLLSRKAMIDLVTTEMATGLREWQFIVVDGDQHSVREKMRLFVIHSAAMQPEIN